MTSGGNKPQIDKSPFRDEIRALLKDKGHADSPTYKELAETIEERYGEELSAEQLGRYMDKHISPEEMMPPERAREELEKKRETIDIAAKRQDLVQIQENRMEQTLETEEQMDGLVLDQASDMIKLTDQLLESLSKDYERLGVLESTTDIEIDVTQVQGNDPFAEMIESTVEQEVNSEEDEHHDYQETTVRDGDEEVDVEQVDSEADSQFEEDEDEVMDKDPTDIDFEDLPDE